MCYKLSKLVLIIFILCFFINPRYKASASNFTTTYDVTYTVNEDSITHVLFHVVLSNKQSHYFASSYALHLGFSDIENLKATSGLENLIPTIIKNNDDKSIVLSFDKKVVGINNSNIFDISFDTKDIALNQGSVWEINIPGLSPKNNFSEFNTHVIFPKSLGLPSFVKPDIDKTKNITVGRQIDLTKEDLGTSGISLGFGQNQIYSFNLLYHLKNKNLFPVHTEIALPPTTNYQTVFLNSLNPKPINVRVDNDGNFLAQYKLLPAQKLDVNALGEIKVSLSPKKEKLTSQMEKTYLLDNAFWQTKDKKIEDLAKKLKTPQNIYDYLVKNLRYDFSKITKNQNRLGAVDALSHKDIVVCLEFTDLFIALARAVGIPAREIDGYAFSNNTMQRPLSYVKDILHAWPEYYDRQAEKWIMVDPTWGNTTGVDYFSTLDFDHIALAIKGESSLYPVPAGGYKFDDSQKDVNISSSKNVPTEDFTLEISSDFSPKFIAGFPITGKVVVNNAGNILSSDKTLIVESKTLTPHVQKIVVSKIPPFGFKTINLNFDRTSFLTNKNGSIKIIMDDRTLSQEFSVAPFFTDRKILILGGVFLASFCISILIFASKSRHIHFFR